MKHIQIFENFQNEKLYRSVDVLEFVDTIKKGSTQTELNSSTFAKIKSIFSSKNTHNIKIEYNDSIKASCIYFTLGENKSILYLFSDDYYVLLKDGKSNFDCYIIDSWDGIEQCLNELLLKQLL